MPDVHRLSGRGTFFAVSSQVRPTVSQGSAPTNAAGPAFLQLAAAHPDPAIALLHPSPTTRSTSPYASQSWRELKRRRKTKNVDHHEKQKNKNKWKHLVRYPMWTGAAATTAGSVLRPGLSLNADVPVLRLHQEFRPDLPRSRLQNTKAKGTNRGRPQSVQ